MIPFDVGKPTEPRVFRVVKTVGEDHLTVDLILVSPLLADVWAGREKHVAAGREFCVVSLQGLAKMKTDRRSPSRSRRSGAAWNRRSWPVTSDAKTLSRGISRDMSPEAIARRRDIVSQLREVAAMLSKTKRLEKVESTEAEHGIRPTKTPEVIRRS
jgi:hypothetical protein